MCINMWKFMDKLKIHLNNSMAWHNECTERGCLFQEAVSFAPSHCLHKNLDPAHIQSWKSKHWLLSLALIKSQSSSCNCKAMLHISRSRVRHEWNQLFCRYKLAKCEMNFRTNWVEMCIPWCTSSYLPFKAIQIWMIRVCIHHNPDTDMMYVYNSGGK